MKGYVTHSKRNSIFKVNVVLRGQRPNKVKILPYRTITVLCKALFKIVWEKSFNIECIPYNFPILPGLVALRQQQSLECHICNAMSLPQRTRISVATYIYSRKLFKFVYANHNLYLLHTITRKMCLQKVNIMRKIEVLCIESLSIYRATLMVILKYLQSLK